MNKTRLEAFSDGVLAIIITIMVLEIKVPHNADWSSLKELIPTFAGYFLSFLYVAIYWGNHHHMMHAVKNISSAMIWANMNLLFWLSLVPFVTGWMGENHFAPNTVAVYGTILELCGISFSILQVVVEKHMKDIDSLRDAFRNLNKKGITSALGYLAAIPLAYVSPIISGVIFLCISIVWLIPDKHIEKALQED